MTFADRARTRLAGFTLIEVMIVVVLVAMLFLGMTFGLGALARAELRSAAVKVAAAARYAYARASTSGETIRLAIDLDNGRIALEQTTDRFTLVRDEASGGAADPEQALDDSSLLGSLRALGENPLGRRAQFSSVGGPRIEPWSLASGIRVARLYTSHEDGPRTDGRGYVYFFAGGMAEHAVVQLQDSRGAIYSVEIHPLSARPRVTEGPVEPTIAAAGTDVQEASDDR